MENNKILKLTLFGKNYYICEDYKKNFANFINVKISDLPQDMIKKTPITKPENFKCNGSCLGFCSEDYFKAKQNNLL